ncbi:MAG TPA: hypothetical protein VFN43_12110, partial [Humibacillus sp.]|nr:hypothetical protein [Humibacillus sp.]
MGRFEESDAPPAADRARALEARLAEVQQHLRATSDILKVLTSGAAEQAQVFDAVVNNARRLLHADVAQIHLLKGDEYQIEWSSGHTKEFLEVVNRYPVRRDNRGTLVGRVGMDRTAQQIKDVLADPDY